MGTSNLKTSLFFGFVITKVVMVFYLSYLTQCGAPQISKSSLAVSSGDTFSYIGAMENYVDYGEYFFLSGQERVFVGRMPHYGVPYWVLRQFLNESQACDGMVLLQLLLEIVAAYLFLSNVGRWLGDTAFYCLLALLTLSTCWTDFAYYLSPESFSTSCLLIFVAFYIAYSLDRRLTWNFYLSAVFLALTVVLKPYFVLVYFVVGVEFIRDRRESLFGLESWRYVLQRSLLFSLPLVVLVAPWIARNYFNHNRFVIFQPPYAGYRYTEADIAFRRFVTSFGGNIIEWEKTSAGCFFIPTPNIQCDYSFPDYVFSKELTYEKIVDVRSSYVSLQQQYSREQELLVVAKFDSLTHSFRRSNPFRYYVLTPFVITKNFLVNSGSYYLPIYKSNPCFHLLQLPIKLSQSMLYWASILIGLSALVILAWRRNIPVLPFIPLMIIVVMPVGFKTAEWRYLRTCEPVLYLGLVYALDLVLSRFIKKAA